MSCREITALMSPYLDGLLDGAKTRRLEKHVSECHDCRHKLELMEEIPHALQTDRMLAPRAEFTTLVMQKIVITSQLQTQGGVQTTTRTEYRSTTTFRSAEATGSESSETTPQNQAKILAFPAPASRPTRSVAAYALRFSSMAAALVVMFGIGIYTLQLGVTSQATVSVNDSIGWFAQTLTSAFQSPPELILGILAALALVAVLWLLFFRTPDRSGTTESQIISPRQDSE